MMNDEMVAELESSLYGRIAELRAQLAESSDSVVELRARVAERDAAIAMLRSRVAERDAAITPPNDADVNRMMAVFDKLSRQADTVKDEMAMAVNSFVGRAQDVVAAKIAENTKLRVQLAERDALIAEVTKTLGGHSDSDLLSLATTVAIGYEQWSDGHDAQVEALRAQVATLNERLSRCACTDDYGNEAP